MQTNTLGIVQYKIVKGWLEKFTGKIYWKGLLERFTGKVYCKGLLEKFTGKVY